MADTTEAFSTTLSHHSHISFCTSFKFNMNVDQFKEQMFWNCQAQDKYARKGLLGLKFYPNLSLYSKSADADDDAVKAFLSNVNTLPISIHLFIVINESSMISNAEDLA
ncbi:predicted protein [Histoplasma capsulatum var. duboisii H88]|uniref:Predicted protein n=1 Tax=Ajellomyces capsulatus (strain H88) TaxID=544711 RepID=F0URW6_AJEC8|nr:predicted protein [Histoplasma capsulatum var. duboisii H88]